MSVTLTPVAGIVIEVCATEPATYDETGYNALSWTAFNDYDNVPSIFGGYEMQTFAGIRTGNIPYRGQRVGRTETFNVPDDDTDAGLTIVDAAFDAAKGSTAEKMSIRVRDENNKYEAAVVLVGNNTAIYGGSNDVKRREIEIGVIPNTEARGTEA